jgi:acetate kinase
VDAITFTAGIGENSAPLRAWICARLTHLGVRLDDDRNRAPGKEDRLISGPESGIAVAVIPTNEELMIARETQRLAAAGASR